MHSHIPRLEKAFIEFYNLEVEEATACSNLFLKHLPHGYTSIIKDTLDEAGYAISKVVINHTRNGRQKHNLVFSELLSLANKERNIAVAAQRKIKNQLIK
ncbi:MAG: hypothetical protein CMM93_08620 [Rickettsiales bacterium]|nr:hypothetical protein [Rickettsiales bacterium]